MTYRIRNILDRRRARARRDDAHALLRHELQALGAERARRACRSTSPRATSRRHVRRRHRQAARLKRRDVQRKRRRAGRDLQSRPDREPRRRQPALRRRAGDAPPLQRRRRAGHPLAAEGDDARGPGRRRPEPAARRARSQHRRPRRPRREPASRAPTPHGHRDADRPARPDRADQRAGQSKLSASGVTAPPR